MRIEIFYDGSVDRKTPEFVEDLKYKYGNKAEIVCLDISEETAPPKYGTINPPVIVLDGKRVIKLEGDDSLEHIVSKAIF